MLIRKSLLALSLLVGLSPLASAQVKLERKAQEGTSQSVEVTTRTDQKLTIAGMETESGSDSKIVVKSTVGKRDEAGNLRVEEKIASMLVTMKVMGSDYVFDSANPDKESGGVFEMMRPLHKAMLRQTTTTVYGKDGKVAQIEYDQNILNELSDDLRQLVKGQFDAEKAKKTANDELDKFPADPVKKGDVWERTSTMNLGAGQVMTISTRYTYEGEIEKDGRTLDKITSKVLTVDFALEAGSPLPFTLKESALKPAETKGELLFDRKTGKVVVSTSSMQIVGDMTFVINGKDLPSKLDLKIESGTQIQPEEAAK
jgi:hypothetical protein